MQYVHVPAWALYAVLVALSSGVYLNTLFASFAFDDSFAVVRSRALDFHLVWFPTGSCCQNVCSVLHGSQVQYCLSTVPYPGATDSAATAQISNGDVTDPNKPLHILFQNDFWYAPMHVVQHAASVHEGVPL